MTIESSATAAPAIYDDVTKLVGRTPLVRLNRVTGDSTANVFAKLEFYNPSWSVKDRIAVAIVDAAEASGVLKPGGTIVEATSGNTGVGLALVGAARGYKVIITLPESASKERRVVLRAYGAELILTPAAGGVKEAVAKAKEIVESTPNSILASQFTNAANPAIHRKTTAEEIWADTQGNVDYFVAGVGTGGTITGVGQVLKERNPDVKIIAVEAAESPLLNGGPAGPHKIQGISPNFIADVLDQGVYDEVLDIPYETAKKTARDIAAFEGILGGPSSGAAVAGALQIAARPEAAGKNIVVIIPDLGERYISTPLYEDLID